MLMRGHCWKNTSRGSGGHSPPDAGAKIDFHITFVAVFGYLVVYFIFKMLVHVTIVEKLILTATQLQGLAKRNILMNTVTSGYSPLPHGSVLTRQCVSLEKSEAEDDSDSESPLVRSSAAL